MTQRYNAQGQLVDLTAEEEAALAARVSAAQKASGLPTVTTKADMWRRCTEDEVPKLYAALQQAPLQQQLIFNAALNVQSDDPLYSTLVGIITSVAGADRAKVIMAPS